MAFPAEPILSVSSRNISDRVARGNVGLPVERLDAHGDVQTETLRYMLTLVDRDADALAKKTVPVGHLPML